MTTFSSFAELRAACLDLPMGHPAASAAVANREAQLTKPQGSLGRLEDLVAWLAHWQGRNPPRLDEVEVLVFAGNHGVTAQGVSAFPAEVTVQMVANFAGGGAAINQLARIAGAEAARHPARPRSADRRLHASAGDGRDANSSPRSRPAMTPCEPQTDLVCLGEMGIGNTTAAAAIAAALFGGGGERWAGRGTGVDDAGLARKRAVIDRRWRAMPTRLHDPLRVAAALGGRELAAILGCDAGRTQASHSGAARRLCLHRRGGAARKLRTDTLGHAFAGHVSAESGHRCLLEALGLPPLLDLDMRLGEASGAALAVSSCARRSPATPAWRRLPRPACRTNRRTRQAKRERADRRLTVRDGVEKRAADVVDAGRRRARAQCFRHPRGRPAARRCRLRSGLRSETHARGSRSRICRATRRPAAAPRDNRDEACAVAKLVAWPSRPVIAWRAPVASSRPSPSTM